MSRLLIKILWYQLKDRRTDLIGDNSYNDPINITNSVNMDVARGLDIKNNILRISLKNECIAFNEDSTNSYIYVNDRKQTIFQEQDQFKVFLHYSDDFAEIESSVWNRDDTSEPSSDYLRGVYYLIEFNPTNGLNGSSYKLTCADKTYILFNKLNPKGYFSESENLTAPMMIQKIVRFASQNKFGDYFGDGEDAGVKYDIDAKLVSNGGYIQDTRKSTYEDGTTNSDTTFPVVTLAKIWKPVYEWINDLSQMEYINTAAELENSGGKKIVYGRPFIYWVDENNKFHWLETSDSYNSSITYGTTAGLYELSLTKKVFDSTNMIIFRGGEDLYGHGTLDYEIDATSDVKTRKMRVMPFTDIAKKWIEKEISLGHITVNASGVYTYSGNRYNPIAFGFTTSWGVNTSGFSNDDYNDSLITRILKDGKARSKGLLAGLSQARYSGTISTKGKVYVQGNLIKLTDSRIGINNELVRIMDIRDNITKDGWFTQLSLEQDAKAIIQGNVS